MQVLLFTFLHSSLSLGILYLILEGCIFMQLPSNESDRTFDAHSRSNLSLISFKVLPFSVLSLSIFCIVFLMLNPCSSNSGSSFSPLQIRPSKSHHRPRPKHPPQIRTAHKTTHPM